ncbi:hypothetical protein LT85_1300 [Collimonas arenae]|uniref:YdhG-like domain-containing protein n=1 Tax=Collimonas arenae TaxID=279058 RepID=A0A0A1F6W3_9BURK|nr:DUF1801 domain-containing protein [Collimonas arenae]AIY40458.1 hypothetical protein LT85_1300 [Collimonas arenae]
MKPIENVAVARTFDTYPQIMRRKLLALRQLIFDTAANAEGVGELEETLRWGEPAYLTSQSKSGTTIRLAWKKSNPTQYGIYFHCQTDLIASFRTAFPDDFKFEGNRCIYFEENDVVPVDVLELCIAAALTYHRHKTGPQAS